MAFNAKKCTVLRIHRKRTPLVLPYNMNGTVLSNVEQATYLGLEIAQDLSWEPQIQKMTKKANNTLHFIRRNLWGSPPKVKEMAYTSMVRPILEYASTVWDPYEATHINEIEKIQRRAARFVTGVFTREASVSGMLKDLGWQTLQTRRCIARLAMLHKTTNHLTATTLPTYVLPSQRTSLRGKHPCSLTPIRANTDRYLYSYFPRTIRCWNILPVELIQLETSQEFKSTLSAGISAGDYMITNPRSVFNWPRLGSCPNSGQALYLF